MDKIKRLFKNMSLRKSIVCYITIFAVIAVFLSTFTAYICNFEAQRIWDSYPISSEKYYLTNSEGERLGNGNYIGNAPKPITAKDQKIINVLELVPIIAAPLYSALCILSAAMLFYHNKLKKPILVLKMASEKISENNLDFSVEYKNNDELGQLCDSFETMRSALAQNYSQMWRQMEERKRLNSAFAHDLRTPLTVLKGYNEMLQGSESTQTRDTAITMAKHISRLESYVDSMSRLQRLEDAQPDYQSIRLQDLISCLSESASFVSARMGKDLKFENTVHSNQVIVDSEIISQVFNNLISNAGRYAACCINVSLQEMKDGLYMSVSDDGNGFSHNSLKNATNPYFTEENNHAEHFGLGLYICKVLCKHHGGYLEIGNTSEGGLVKAFFKYPVL